MNDDFSRLLFLHVHSETSALADEIAEESGQFRFLRVPCLVNLKSSVGLTFPNDLRLRTSMPLDLFSRHFIPLPCFIRSRCPTPILVPSLVFYPPRSA
jgi:hypothetical protein